ncbi:MAG: PAS domain S-box protein [Chloroflexi bacterium]|nr:PAS domain S-box protein [Chloroflexota bacterium]
MQPGSPIAPGPPDAAAATDPTDPPPSRAAAADPPDTAPAGGRAPGGAAAASGAPTAPGTAVERPSGHAVLSAEQLGLGALGSLIEASLDGIVVVDEAGRYVYANPAACRILGYRLERLVGRAS